MKIICPSCGRENDYSPAVGCLLKCRHCADWFAEPTPLQSQLVPCPFCAQDITPGAPTCPCCSHPLPAQPAVPPRRERLAGKIIMGLLFLTLGIWILFTAWRAYKADQHPTDNLERQALDLNRR
jgi:hypothetical protein